MPHVLVVEDQPAVSKALRVLFDMSEIPCAVVHAPEAALEAVERDEVGVVVQDMNFAPGETSGREGIELFRRIRRLDPDLPVLVLTAWTSLETAVQLVKEGASDYLAKPWDDTKLVATVRNLLRMRALQLENRRLRVDKDRAREDLSRAHDLCGVLYESAAMHQVVSLAAQVAGADVPVLVTGPNGAGKEKVAEIIQANSRRRGGPFVKVNVGALPDELLESELFGAEAGAYTGAVKRRLGRFEAADQGTLFLDEIGTLSPAGQIKVLRVLQCGEFERLGSSETRRVDVRILAATNVDLREAIAAGRFRADLFFRLNVIEIAVPPLRDRPEDVRMLAEAFLRRFSAESGAGPRSFSDAARVALLDHGWPGNVRELMNRVQRATVLAAGPVVTEVDLGLAPEEAGGPCGPTPAGEDDSERRRIEAVLLESGGTVSKAAARLGVSRQALYRRMERLGIVMERRPKI
jgi:DNA-binding NtrC family response regulator